jgi:hypothetical protein
MFECLLKLFGLEATSPRTSVTLSATSLEGRECPTTFWGRASLVALPPSSLVSINPQPLPPGRFASINPQPLPPGRAVSINPQPLPPGMAVAINPQPLPPGLVWVG